jgi:hypothetical protein
VKRRATHVDDRQRAHRRQIEDGEEAAVVRERVGGVAREVLGALGRDADLLHRRQRAGIVDRDHVRARAAHAALEVGLGEIDLVAIGRHEREDDEAHARGARADGPAEIARVGVEQRRAVQHDVADPEAVRRGTLGQT